MKKTIAEAFVSDQRVQEARRLILRALEEHSSRITEVRPADPERRVTYEDLLNDYSELRGGQLYYPYLGSGIGNRALVELADGSVKYDFISGIGVHHWGHSHPEIVEAALIAALSDTTMQGNLQQNVESVALTRMLLKGANRRGASMKHCFLSTSGAMANENALKILFQKTFPANRILAFEGCFMGRTLALSQVTDKAAYRDGLPSSLFVDYVPFFDPEQPEESTKRAVDCLEHYLTRYPGKHAGMVFELILGEGGFHPGNREFFAALMRVLSRHRIPVMIDEIQTFGRTTELFAFQYFNLDEFVDLVTVGKASQVCATLFREDLRPRPGLISQTFTSSTAAIVAGRVIVQGLMDGGYLGPEGKIARLQDRCVGRLKELRDRRPDLIDGPFGIGAMVAFTPLGGKPETVKEFVHALFDAGVIAFTAGSDGSRVRFLLPVGAVTEEDIDAAVSITEATLVQMSS